MRREVHAFSQETAKITFSHKLSRYLVSPTSATGRQHCLEIQSRHLKKKKLYIFFSPESQTEIILICISGNRSLHHTLCGRMCRKIR